MASVESWDIAMGGKFFRPCSCVNRHAEEERRNKYNERFMSFVTLSTGPFREMGERGETTRDSETLRYRVGMVGVPVDTSFCTPGPTRKL
jgi:hypothetical protein